MSKVIVPDKTLWVPTRNIWVPKRNLRGMKDCRGFISTGMIGAIAGSRRRAGGGGPPAVIDSLAASLGANGGTSGPIDATGANLIVILGSWYPASTPNPAPTDSYGNTPTPLTASPVSSGTNKTQLFYYYGTNLGSGYTVTFTGTSIYGAVCVIAMSNMAASPFDQETGAAGSVFGVVQPGSITPSQANNVLFTGAGCDNNGGAALTVDGGFSPPECMQVYVGGVSEGAALAVLIQISATAQNPTWTTGNIPRTAVMASFNY